MATTKLISMHVNKGKTVAQCLNKRIGYIKNDDKSADGELITSYQCAAETADKQFLLSKNIY